VSEDHQRLAELSARWWEYRRLSQGDRSERKALELGEPVDACAAADIVTDRIDAGGVAAIELVVALIETAPDDAGIAYVGAGPLEDLVHEHGGSLVDDLDRVARQNPAFGQAMRSVWLSTGVLNGDVERRLRKWIPG
jgi:hypothetical protein